MNSTNSPTTKPLYRGTQIIWYIVGLINILLGVRFLLKFLSANPNAGFTQLVYTVTEPLIVPFARVFGTSFVEDNVFEWTTLLAMVVYVLIGWGITKLLLMGKTVSTPEAAAQLD